MTVEERHIVKLWLALVVLTIVSAAIAESGRSGLGITVFVAVVLAIKGRIVVDHFMELKHANIVLRRLMRGYFYVIPGLMIIVYLFPELISRLTKL